MIWTFNQKNNMAREANPKKAFRKGFLEVKIKDQRDVRSALCTILGVYSAPSFQKYLYGRSASLDVEKARQIEELFASYGITEPWGLE